MLNCNMETHCCTLKPICEVYLKCPQEEACCNDATINALRSYLSLYPWTFEERLRHDSFGPNTEFIRIFIPYSESAGNNTQFDWKTVDLELHFIYLEETISTAENINGCDGDTESTTASHNWILPCRPFDGVWESLYFGGYVKQRLLRYAKICLKLGESRVDPNVVLCNRLILLHGPPGTGKTTICRALAQKLSIRMNSQYAHTQLVEVNCHSLFSKWFSESGKLVSKMFETIRQYAEDRQSLVVVLIDEVESLTSARQAAINSNEPSDAIRVVNAVLTQLDSLRFFPNILVMATSNLTSAIDSAFTDRADVIQFIGLPGEEERALILKSCLEELRRANIIHSASKSADLDGSLKSVVEACSGLSGRTMRKLPVIALAEAEESEGLLDSNRVMELLLAASKRLIAERSIFIAEYINAFKIIPLSTVGWTAAVGMCEDFCRKFV